MYNGASTDHGTGAVPIGMARINSVGTRPINHHPAGFDTSNLRFVAGYPVFVGKTPKATGDVECNLIPVVHSVKPALLGVPIDRRLAGVAVGSAINDNKQFEIGFIEDPYRTGFLAPAQCKGITDFYRLCDVNTFSTELASLMMTFPVVPLNIVDVIGVSAGNRPYMSLEQAPGCDCLYDGMMTAVVHPRYAASRQTNMTIVLSNGNVSNGVTGEFIGGVFVPVSSITEYIGRTFTKAQITAASVWVNGISEFAKALYATYARSTEAYVTSTRSSSIITYGL